MKSVDLKNAVKRTAAQSSGIEKPQKQIYQVELHSQQKRLHT